MLKRSQATMVALLACLVIGLALPDRASTQVPSQNHTTSAAQQDTNSETHQNQPSKSLGQSLSEIWNRTWDDPVAFYTFVLTIFTGLLAVISAFQIFSLIGADKTARISAEAAKKSADAAMGVALPRFVVTEIRIQRGGGETVEEALYRPIQITLVNMGQSAAIILRECLVFAVSDKLPEIPSYPAERIRNINFRFPVEARAHHQISEAAVGMTDFGEPFGIDPLEAKKVAGGPSTLWVYGYIAYRDFLDEVSTKGFCARMDVEDEHERFVQDGPEAYSQTKRG